MRFLKSLFPVIIFVGLICSDALAHDKVHHKGKPTEGEIGSIALESFELVTESKSYTVIVDDKTKFEMGEKKVSQEYLTKDMRVKVFGTKLPGAKIAASEVLIEEYSSHDYSDGHH